jgi:uncharacterized protein (TIGR02145 family)
MKMTGQTDEATIAKLLVQIGGALEYLHSQDPPVIHRDIKPENILADISGNYYLSDFGISSKLRRTLTKSMGRSQESSGTTAFMAPELFQAKRQVLPESDLFSFGAMLYELITDELPFGQIGGAMLMNGAQVPDISDQCSATLANLIASCLDIDIAKRPTAAELKEAGAFYLKNKYWNTNNTGKQKSDRKTQPFQAKPTDSKSHAPVTTPLDKNNPGKGSKILFAALKILRKIGTAFTRKVVFIPLIILLLMGGLLLTYYVIRPGFMMEYLHKRNLESRQGTFTDDRDGHTYKTIKIGEKVWMAENLAYKANEGCWAYNNEDYNVEKYGYLYNWETACEVAPKGWHLPSSSEFRDLLDISYRDYYMNYLSDFELLTISDRLGFSAVFGGWAYSNGNKFGEIGRLGIYWSSSVFKGYESMQFIVNSESRSTYLRENPKDLGCSVRCVRD